MATWRSGTVNNTTYTGGSSWNATRDITAGDLVIFCVTWENSQTLSSVSDTAGGSWAIATQDDYDGSSPQPIGAIAYCLSHPGGTGVTVTGTFSGTADAILEADLICFQPDSGKTFEFDLAASPGTGVGVSFTVGGTGSITTTGPGVVVQFLSGFQLTSSVAAGGSPAFTRDTGTENNGVGRSFAQYYLSGSGQSITPGASWGSLGAKYVFLAAAFKEVASGGGGSANAICWIRA